MKKLLLLFLFALPVFAMKSVHTELGAPSGILSSDLIWIERDQYVVNYRTNYGSPMWVAYNLNKDWFGEVDRYEGNFITDTSLPAINRIKHADYTNSGYDRGHMVRSEERTATVADNKSTFLMTNIIPQTPELNRQTWLSFEYYCEKLCKQENKELYIYTGPQYTNEIKYINDKVAIPDSCFKIVVIMERGQGFNDVNENTKIIAVMMPNNVDVKNHDWEEYIRTVRTIEFSTGLDFFREFNYQLQETLENKIYSSVETNDFSIQVFPNPANDYINVKGLENYDIYDVFGNIVLYSNTAQVNTSGFPTGLYYINYLNNFVPFLIVR